MKNLGSDSKKAMEELEKGRELASLLRRWIEKSNGGDDDKDIPFAQDLAERVVSSFSNTLLLLNLRPSKPDDVVSPLQDSSCLLQAKSEDTEDSCRSTSNVKEKRGCYKRRRTATTWEKESEAPIDDGHAWRKYGQKIIMNAKYPRNYFRCTHKFDQKCQATKQVQRIQEEPVLFRTTYYSHHTCNRNLLNPEIILDSDPASESSILLSFHNSQNTHHPFFSTTPTPTPTPSSSPLPKKPCKEEIPSSSEDYLFSPELMPLSSTLESHSHHSRDVIPDDMFDSAELDVFDVFEF